MAQARDGHRVDAGLVAQLARGPRRERAAEHRHAAGLPRLSGGVEPERLAGARGGTDDIDAVAAARQRAHEPALLVAEGRACVDGDGDGELLGDGDLPAAPPDRGVEQLALGAKQLAGRVTRLAGDGIERDDVRTGDERVGLRFDLADACAAQVHTATAILADIRREEPFCFTVLGIAVAVTDRLVVVTDDASSVPYLRA